MCANGSHLGGERKIKSYRELVNKTNFIIEKPKLMIDRKVA